MANISIISACNNNCSYCFQKGYHEQNKIMPLDEIKRIIDWFHPSKRVGFLGGEPTLHPDIVEAVEYTVSVDKTPMIMTNMLCSNEKMEQLSKIEKLRWLVNSNYREELKDLFFQNIEILRKNRFEKENFISIGVTLTGKIEEDKTYIEKQFSAIKACCGFQVAARIGLSTDFHNGNCEIKDFSESINYFIDKLEEENLDIAEFSFDCGINFCNVDPDTLARLLEHDKSRFELGCKGPAMDILLDGSIMYCFCCPEDFLKVKSYTYFKDSDECAKWFIEASKVYILKNGYLCRYNRSDCANEICNGCCPAANEYMRRKYNLQLR